MPGSTLTSQCQLSPKSDASCLSIRQSNQLQRQSSRWLNLSTTLWAISIRGISCSDTDEYLSGLSSFLDVMEWKMTGKVNDEEFTFLYSEWKKHSYPQLGSGSDESQPCSYVPDIQRIRQILLLRNASEEDLSQFIGYVIHESNMTLLNIPISYQMRNSTMRNVSNLELCSDSWLILCESLFFSLDVMGYGFLQFDDILFFCGCLIIGTFSTDKLVKGQYPELVMTNLTATATQLMKDIDCDHQDCNHYDGISSHITLPTFESYFLRRGIGCIALKALIQHVTHCLRELTSVFRMDCDVDILQSCMSIPLSRKQADDIIDRASSITSDYTANRYYTVGSTSKERTDGLHSCKKGNQSQRMVGNRLHYSDMVSSTSHEGVGSDCTSPFPVSCVGGSSASPRRLERRVGSSSCTGDLGRGGVNNIRGEEGHSPEGQGRKNETPMHSGAFVCKGSVSENSRLMEGVSVPRIAGPPRMWRRAVMIAAGYGYEDHPKDEILSGGNNGDNLEADRVETISAPPIILFLLCDTDRLLSRFRYVLANPTEQSHFLPPGNQNTVMQTGISDETISSSQSIKHGSDVRTDRSRSVNSPYDRVNSNADSLIDEELHSTVFKIWQQFQSWGLNAHKNNLFYASNSNYTYNKLENVGVSSIKEDQNEDGENLKIFVRKDPIYSMILAALMDYKCFLTRFISSFQNIANHIVGKSSAHFDIHHSSRVSVSLLAACVALTPDRSRRGKEKEKEKEIESVGELELGWDKDSSRKRFENDHLRSDQYPGITTFYNGHDSNNEINGNHHNCHSDDKNYGKNNIENNNDNIYENNDEKNCMTTSTITNIHTAMSTDTDTRGRVPLQGVSVVSDPGLSDSSNAPGGASKASDSRSSLECYVELVKQTDSPRGKNYSDPVLLAQKRSVVLDKLLTSCDLQEQMKIVQELKMLDSPLSDMKRERDLLKNRDNPVGQLSNLDDERRAGNSADTDSHGNSSVSQVRPSREVPLQHLCGELTPDFLSIDEGPLKYAFVLQEILKQMPTEKNTQDHLKSMQKVLKLGYDLSQKERNEEEGNKKVEEKGKEIGKGKGKRKGNRDPTEENNFLCESRIEIDKERGIQEPSEVEKEEAKVKEIGLFRKRNDQDTLESIFKKKLNFNSESYYDNDNDSVLYDDGTIGNEDEEYFIKEVEMSREVFNHDDNSIYDRDQFINSINNGNIDDDYHSSNIPPSQKHFSGNRHPDVRKERNHPEERISSHSQFKSNLKNENSRVNESLQNDSLNRNVLRQPLSSSLSSLLAQKSSSSFAFTPVGSSSADSKNNLVKRPEEHHNIQRVGRRTDNMQQQQQVPSTPTNLTSFGRMAEREKKSGKEKNEEKEKDKDKDKEDKSSLMNSREILQNIKDKRFQKQFQAIDQNCEINVEDNKIFQKAVSRYVFNGCDRESEPKRPLRTESPLILVRGRDRLGTRTGVESGEDVLEGSVLSYVDGQNESTTYRHGHIRSSYDNNYKNFKSTVNGGTADPAPRASSFENSKHRFQKKIPGTTPGGSKSSIKVKLDSI